VYNLGSISAGGSGTANVVGTGGSIGGTGVSGSGSITSNNGAVTVTGAGANGIVVNGTISAGGSGTVTVLGTGSSSLTGAVGAHRGVTVSGQGLITSSGGNVNVTGFGGADNGGGSQNTGVVAAGTISAGGSGTVTVVGIGGNSTGTTGDSGNDGVMIGPNPSGSAGGPITSSGGNVFVTGTGGGGTSVNSNSNIGIVLGGTSTRYTAISAGGSGTVTVVGQGGPSGAYDIGVQLNNVSTITSSGGAVSVTGTGGSNALNINGNTNDGIDVEQGEITAGGTGTVTVLGTGGTSGSNGSLNEGVELEAGLGYITSGGGDVSVAGVSGSGPSSYGINLAYAGTISTATAGNITLTGDSISGLYGAGLVNAQTRTVTIVPMTPGLNVNLGAGDTPNQLSFYSSLAGVTAGTVNVGNSSTGPITVSSPTTFAGTAATNLNLTNTPGASMSFPASGTDVNLDGGTLTTSSGSNLNIAINGATVDTQYNQLKVGGTVNLSGVVLSLTGGYTSSSGNVFTIVSATSVSGTFNGLLNSATTNFNGRTLRVNYTATAVTLTDIGAMTVATLGSTPSSSPYGQLVTLTATVSASLGTPTGQVDFNNGSTILGVAPLSGNTASLAISTLVVGTYTITAQYVGLGSTFAASTSANSNTLTITPAALTITADNKTMSYGATLPALTATFAGLVNNDTPTAISGLVLATAPANSAVGSYAITATGATDPNYNITLNGGMLVINPASSTTTVSDAGGTHDGSTAYAATSR